MVSPTEIAQALFQGQRAQVAPTTGVVPQPQLRPDQAAIAQALQQQQAPQREFATPQGASLASELLGVSQDRLGNPIIRGIAGFLGARELGKERERAGEERRVAKEEKAAAAEAAAQQREIENVRAEEELVLKRQGLEAKQELNLFNRDRQVTQDAIAQTERTRKAGLDERRIRLSEDAATQKVTQAQAVKEQKKIDQEFTFTEKDAAAETSINLIDDLLAHPGLNAAVGFGAQKLIPFRTDDLGQPEFAQGSDAADFQARFNQIKSETFLQGFNRLKGGGTITEAEGRKAESAISRMSLSQSEKEFKTAVGDLRGIIDTGKRRAAAQAKAKGITLREIPQQSSAPGGGIKFLGFE